MQLLLLILIDAKSVIKRILNSVGILPNPDFRQTGPRRLAPAILSFLYSSFYLSVFSILMFFFLVFECLGTAKCRFCVRIMSIASCLFHFFHTLFGIIMSVNYQVYYSDVVLTLHNASFNNYPTFSGEKSPQCVDVP